MNALAAITAMGLLVASSVLFFGTSQAPVEAAASFDSDAPAFVNAAP